jgi:hypothetical protein
MFVSCLAWLRCRFCFLSPRRLSCLLLLLLFFVYVCARAVAKPFGSLFTHVSFDSSVAFVFAVVSSTPSLFDCVADLFFFVAVAVANVMAASYTASPTHAAGLTRAPPAFFSVCNVFVRHLSFSHLNVVLEVLPSSLSPLPSPFFLLLPSP